MDIGRLYEKLEKHESSQYFDPKLDILYYLSEISEGKRPPCVNAYLAISNWLAMSRRSGVWTFYEAIEPRQIQDTVDYLRAKGEIEFAKILESGMHDYRNPVYAENYDYPEEWMEEAEGIDTWIREHERWIEVWLEDVLLENKSMIMELKNEGNDL